MWILVFRDTKKIHLVGRGKFVPENHEMKEVDKIEIPDQDLSHLYEEDIAGVKRLRLDASLDDVVQYTAEEKSKLPSAALAALKARGPATNESMPGLSERVGLIERILGIEVE